MFRIIPTCLAALLAMPLHAGGTPADDGGGPVAPPPVFNGAHHSAASRNAADPLGGQGYTTLSPQMLDAMVAAGLIGAAASYVPVTRPRKRPDHFRHPPRHHAPDLPVPHAEHP